MLAAGGGRVVIIAALLRLEPFQAVPYGKCRLKSELEHLTTGAAAADRGAGSWSLETVPRDSATFVADFACEKNHVEHGRSVSNRFRTSSGGCLARPSALSPDSGCRSAHAEALRPDRAGAARKVADLPTPSNRSARDRPVAPAARLPLQPGLGHGAQGEEAAAVASYREASRSAPRMPELLRPGLGVAQAGILTPPRRPIKKCS